MKTSYSELLTKPAIAFRRQGRQGAALAVVMVVFLLLAVGAYRFSQRSLGDYELAAISRLDLQSRLAADSGIEWVATAVTKQTGSTGSSSRSSSGTSPNSSTESNFYQNPAWFQGRLVTDHASARGRIRFSIVAPIERDLRSQRIRFGLSDESARLNLNVLDQLKLDDDQIIAWLAPIPGMTSDLTNAIRDWIDTDDETRDGGAESDYYSTLSPPYQAKNASLESLDELLLVKGVTASLLYGEDANRNGLLDPNENDGAASLPFDNANGQLDHGWSAFFSAYSRESNLRADGTERINVNTGLLSDLYDQIEEEFDEDTAKFVVAFRMAGPKDNELPGQASGTSGGSGSSNGGSIGGRSTGTSGGSGSTGSGRSGGSSGGSPAGSSTSAAQQQQVQKALQQAAVTIVQSMADPGAVVSRGGMNLAAGAKQRVNSLYDLVDSRADAIVGGSATILTSPWSSQSGDFERTLPKLLDVLSTTGDEFILGRLNINEAPAEVLSGVPYMTQDMVDRITSSQMLDSAGNLRSDTLRKRQTTAWLVTEGLTDMATMRALDQYFTTRGDVHRVQSIGFSEAGGPTTRVEAVIDSTQNPPRVVFRRDLTDLGRGYPRAMLFPAASE